jgi:HEAT repeat protein
MDASRLVQALSVAWSGVHLYPDPEAVPAFSKAVETVGEFAGSGVVLTVTVDGFVIDDEILPGAQGATERLVRALFSQQVETVTIAEPPSPDDLVRFFAVLEESGAELPERLATAGVTTVRVRCHELLGEREADESAVRSVARHPEVADLFEEGSVNRVVERFEGAASPDGAMDEFLDSYLATYGKVGADDPAGLERVVQTWVDAFFRLDQADRAAVFAEIVIRREQLPFANFLDQLSADELEELAGVVDDDAVPLLVQYARIVTEMQGRDDGLVQRIMAGAHGPEPSRAVSASIGAHLAEFLKRDASSHDLVASLQAEVAVLDAGRPPALMVIEDLFAIEDRDERTARLLRVWLARVANAVRDESFSEALEWLRVLDEIELDPDVVEEAYRQLATGDVLEILTQTDSEENRAAVLAEVARRSAPEILEQLATEEDPGRRRTLIEVVSRIARADLQVVLPALADPRWYLVRNVVMALGRSERKSVTDPLTRLLRHSDHRVRIEALRALRSILGEAASSRLVSALTDDHIRVRATAADLLDTLDDSSVVPALDAALANEQLPLASRLSVIGLLGRRSTAPARRSLEAVASSRPGLSRQGRVLRSAARHELKGIG